MGLLDERKKILEEQKEKNFNQATQKLISLNQTSKVELENSLLKESLSLSHEQLDKFQNKQEETLQKIAVVIKQLSEKIKQIETSNQQLEKSINQEIGNITDRVDTIISQKTTQINKKLVEYIQNINQLNENAQKRFKSFYDRKRIIDILIFVNLGISPILFLIIAYLVFIKK